MQKLWGASVVVAGSGLLACGGQVAAPDAFAAPDGGIDSGPELDAGDELDAGEELDAGADAGTVTIIRLLAFNDFHGAIYNAPYLAGEIAARRTPNTVVVTSGDLIGGSPIASGAFHDQPTIEVMNAMGLDYAAVGNHELDEGRIELERMQSGGCHPVDGCSGDGTFAGASFAFLAANTVNDDTGDTIFPPYAIRDVDGVRLAFVGMTLEATPTATLASAIPELSFGDEVETMLALAPELDAAGAEVIVLLLHEGGHQIGGANECLALTGAIVAIAAALEGVVPVIVSGHSHGAYVCDMGDLTLTSAGSSGRLLTQIDLQLDTETGAVVGVTAENIAIDDTLTADPTVAMIVDDYEALIAPVRDAVIGTITADISGMALPSGEIPAGSVIADAMLAGTAADGAQVALMNGGGVRNFFRFALTAPETVDGQVTYGEAFRVQPFSNEVSTVSLTGADLVAALDERTQILQVAGLTYTWDATAPVGSRVLTSSVMVGGVPLVTTDVYRVTVNSIVADPVNTPAMARAFDVVGVGVDLDLLLAYFERESPVAPPVPGRITRLP